MKKLFFASMALSAWCFTAMSAPFPAEKIAGIWKMSKGYVTESGMQGSTAIAEIKGRISAVLTFLNGGKCRMTLNQVTGGNVGRPTTLTYNYEYTNGIFRIVSTVGLEDRNISPGVPCLNATRFELRGIDGDSFELKYADLQEHDRFYGFMKMNCRSQYNEDGTLEVKREWSPGGVKQVSTAKHPPMIFHRVAGLAPESAVKEDCPIYKMLSLQKEEGCGYAYRFKLEMLDESGGRLNAYHRVQHEFRSMLLEEAARTFDGDFSTLFVEFPAFNLKGKIVEGRAVVLTMKPLSLAYNPETRRGSISISLAANQFDVARRLVRKNIEALARNSNIVVENGQLPPAAKFYLGREEVKDGNVLEVEFMTE